MAATVESVRDAFAMNDFVIEEESVLRDCVSIVRQLGLEASELADEFEVQVLNSNMSLRVAASGARVVTRSAVAAVRSRVQADRVKRTRAAMDPMAQGNAGLHLSKEDLLESLATTTTTTTPMMKRSRKMKDDDVHIHSFLAKISLKRDF